jgi:iron complex transport system permease protein
MMQTFFRNPLAGPDVLGLSSGASLLVAITILAQATIPINIVSSNAWGVALAATLGAFLVFIIAVLASQKVKDNSSLLIIGMMVAAFTSSLVSMLQFLSRADDLQAFFIWGLGSVGGTNWKELQVMAIALFISLLISSTCIKPLNAWFLGENYSKSIGVNVKKARFWIVLSTSLMVGTITAFCGPIAFVGLAVPHLVKLVLPHTNHLVLLPAVGVGGAILLLLCDTISQLPGSAQVLPLNAVTSFIGAPILIWVVIKNKRSRLNG